MDDQTKLVLDMIPDGWDKNPYLLALEIRELLQSVKDEGTNIDSGTNGEVGDLWLTVQGVEYYITIKKSNKNGLL
jgi:hypothetical protein